MPHPDRARWNEIYSEGFRKGRVNANLVAHVNQLKRGRVLDLAGGLGQNGAWLASYSDAFRVVNADVSDQALLRASPQVARVVVDAGALPFSRRCFDTLLNIRFYDARIHFADWLTRGGTVFFETFTEADAKYRLDFNPAHRFHLDEIPRNFDGLEILYRQETDDGHRAYVTLLARRV